MADKKDKKNAGKKNRTVLSEKELKKIRGGMKPRPEGGTAAEDVLKST